MSDPPYCCHSMPPSRYLIHLLNHLPAELHILLRSHTQCILNSSYPPNLLSPSLPPILYSCCPLPVRWPFSKVNHNKKRDLTSYRCGMDFGSASLNQWNLEQVPIQHAFQYPHRGGWWSGSSSKSTCLASVRSQVQIPVLPKKCLHCRCSISSQKMKVIVASS
jgi:hypothetical protein